MKNTSKWRRCPTCWNWFSPNMEHGSIGFFCSARCLEIDHRVLERGVWRICRLRDCGQEFIAMTPRQRCCSEFCIEQVREHYKDPRISSRIRRHCTGVSSDPMIERAYADRSKDHFSRVSTVNP